MADYLQLVKDKESENTDLNARMDADNDLVELAKKSLTDVAGRPIPKSIYVTLNRPAVFAANVEAALNAASEQVAVTSDDEKIDTAYIEDFIKMSFRSADSRLTTRGWFPLNPYIDQQMCEAGGGLARCITKIQEIKDANNKPVKQLITDITPWDRRYASYAMGEDGLEWAAYRTTRTKDQINSEYLKVKGYTGGEITTKEAEVLDIWTTEGNIVYIAENKVLEQPHTFGFCPVAVQIVTLGSMRAYADSHKYRGESIFFLIRDLVPDLNRLVSIIMNINMAALDRGRVWYTKDGQKDIPEYSDLTDPGKVVGAETGGGPGLMPIGEVQSSIAILESKLESAITQGSMEIVNLSDLPGPMSAVSLIQIGEGQDKIFLPRLAARGMLNTRLAEMMIDQVVNSKESQIMVGTRRQKKTFQISKLAGEYNIDFKYFVKSPQTDMARVSMAAAYGNLIPDSAKRREVLVREDPDEDERRLRWEEAERLSPAIKIHRAVKALIEMADRGDEDARLEAEMLSATMGVSLQQALAGQTGQTPQIEQAQKPQPLMPMFAGGGGRQAVTSTPLETTPQGGK